ncbi:MAG: adenine phosphoribosyltransferase [Steroidobacteraceae bacterium]
MYDLKRHIVEVPDFPKPGILFRDITPLLRSHFQDTLAAVEALFSADEWRATDALAGIESRGFILAAGLAARLDKGFIPIRKGGKLPPPVEAVDYTLEYGNAVLELQRGSGHILLIDDVVATGGTMAAAARLARAAGFSVGGFATLVDLHLRGAFHWEGMPLRSVLSYD